MSKRLEDCLHRCIIQKNQKEHQRAGKVRFFGYVLIKHRQTNNGAKLWAPLEALQGFWVPILAILTDSQYLQQGASGKAQNWKSRGWTTSLGALKAIVLVWELSLHEMSKPDKQVRWEHVPAHANVHGNEVANGFTMEGMCSNPLWSGKRHYDQGSDTESTVGLRGGSDSDATKGIWEELGL